MKVLKAKIKKSSVHYRKGLNPKGKSIWLTIADFNPRGIHNYSIKTIKGIKNGFAEYQNVWMGVADISLKHFEDGQLTLDIFSEQEMLENINNPVYFNQRRFEIVVDNSNKTILKPNCNLSFYKRKDVVIKSFKFIPLTEYFYLLAPDFEKAQKMGIEFGYSGHKISQVPRLTKEEINE